MILIYLGLIVWLVAWSIPLLRTVLAARRDIRAERSLRRRMLPDDEDSELEVTLGRWLQSGFFFMVGILSTVGSIVVLNYYIDYLWFAEVQNQEARFWQQFLIVWKLFGALFLIGFALAAASLAAALVARKRSMKAVAYGSVMYGIVGGLVLGLTGAQTDWVTVMEYLYHTPGGVSDPVFGKELSFYMFELPFYKSVHGFAFIAILLCIPALALTITKKVSDSEKESRHVGNDLEQAKAVARSVFAIELGIAVAAVFVYWAFWFYLERYDLVFGEHGVIHGVDWINATLTAPWLKVSMWLALLAAVGTVAVSFFARRYAVLYVVTATAVILFTAGPALWTVRYFKNEWQGKANHITLNLPYAEHTIAFTRAAFNIGDESLTATEFPIVDDMTEEDLVRNRATLDAARIWDYAVYDRRITQTQRVKGFYDFVDVDLDRYTDEDGVIHPVLIALRDLDRRELPAAARSSWVNMKMKYTHGYGAVVSPVNQFVGNGEPVYYLGGLDAPSSVPWLKLDEPRVYFGHGYADEVYVNAVGEDEFDRPDQVGAGNRSNRYNCDAGIELSSFTRKLAAVWHTGNFRILTSDYIGDETRMLIKRDVTERITSLVPFMGYDKDWYTVIHDGRMVAVLDLYTMSDYYPFAQSFDGVRYIRNSVKATMDLCHGTVNLYVFDEEDPIMQTYQAAFPGLFKPRSEMPDGLEAHIRYPEGLYNAQYQAYAIYHVDDPEEFYNGTDVWSTPRENHWGNYIPLDARYVVAQLPEADSPEFMLMRPYVFKFGGNATNSSSRPKMTGWLAGLSDGENYGKLVAYRFPKDLHVDGTEHIEQRIETYEPFAESFRNWERGETKWFRGNLIVLPMVGGQIVAFEPIYTQASSGAIPDLKRVISVQLRPHSSDSIRIVWGQTYEESRAALLDYATSVGLLRDSDRELSSLSDGELIDLVRGHLQAHKMLSGNGQFSEAGAELESALQALEAHRSAELPVPNEAPAEPEEVPADDG